MPQIAGIGLLAACVPVLTLALDGADRVDVRRRLRRRQLLARAHGAVPAGGLRRRAAVDQLHRRGRLRGGGVLPPAPVVAPRHGGDGVGPRPHQRSSSPSSCCRSPPTCSPAGASATSTATRPGVKYYLMGVFASAVMLYGMSLLFGVTGQHPARRHRRQVAGGDGSATPRRSSRSASCSSSSASPSRCRRCPFHTWAPDTYEGAPTPITAFLAVRRRRPASWRCSQLISSPSPARHDVVEPLMWVLAAADHDGRQPDRPAPDEHHPHARLLRRGPGRLHARPRSPSSAPTRPASRSAPSSPTCSSTRP